MVDFDFSFPKYIAKRYGEVAARIQAGAAYAFAGERRVRVGLVAAKPVMFSLAAATSGWVNRSRPKLLKRAVHVNNQTLPEFHVHLVTAAKILGITTPQAYIHESESLPLAGAFGESNNATLWFHKKVTTLEPELMAAVVAWACAEWQNDHAPLTTAMLYLKNDAELVVRVPGKIAALAIHQWRRRADITSDRAALIVAQDLSITSRVLFVLSGLPDPGSNWQGNEQNRGIRTRIAALELFARSAFYINFTKTTPENGTPLSSDQLDDEVTAVVGTL